MIYLDHNAMAPVLSQVFEAMKNDQAISVIASAWAEHR